jgi:DNA gyrase/topoisomerase IV subunit B
MVEAKPSSSYSVENIQVLQGLEYVRRRPHLYVGELEREELFDDLILEALCHAIDEAVDLNCKQIAIDIKSSGTVLIQYDAGISLDIHPKSGKRTVHVLLTSIGACHNLKKHTEVGSEYCRYGLAVLNAMCSEFQVSTVYNGQSGQQVYRKGDAEQDFVLSSSKASNQTQFCFTLDEDFLGKHEVHIESLQARIEKLEQVFESRLSISCIYTLV